MDEKQIRSIVNFFDTFGPHLNDPNTRARLAASPDVELIPMPRDLVEGLLKPGALEGFGGFGGFGNLLDAGASSGGDGFFDGFGRPDFGRPMDPFINPGSNPRGLTPDPGFGGTPRGFPGFPGGRPGSLTAGASDGGFFDGGFGRPDFGRPDFGRPVFDRMSPLNAQIVAKARPELLATLDGFLDNLEANKVDKAMSFVAKDFASSDGLNSDGLKERLQAFVDATQRRRILVKRTVGIEAGRDQIATRLEITGGARMTDGTDASLDDGMTVDVIFEKTSGGWKISGLSKAK